MKTLILPSKRLVFYYPRPFLSWKDLVTKMTKTQYMDFRQNFKNTQFEINAWKWMPNLSLRPTHGYRGRLQRMVTEGVSFGHSSS